MIDATTPHTRLIDKFMAYLCCYVAMVLLVDHLGKFSLPANQYRIIFWFSILVVLYLLTVNSAKDLDETLHWLDIRALSRKEWYGAFALMAVMVLECLLIACLGFGA